jgi:prolyl-tRNA synthetase
MLRGREFRMKDMYSFHPDPDSLRDFYEVAREAYFKIFEKLGLKEFTYYAAASGGDFTEDFSHEFQVKCENGRRCNLLFKRGRNSLQQRSSTKPWLLKLESQEKPIGNE